LQIGQCFNDGTMINLTSSQLRQAANIKDKIAALEKQLAAITGTKAAPIAKAPKKKGGMSAAGKAKIAAAQKLRWAKVKAAKPAVVKPVKKGGMSAAGKARIAAAQKLRWAKVKAAKATPKAVKPAQKPAKKKFKMSAAAKGNQSAKMKAYWAAKKAGAVKK